MQQQKFTNQKYPVGCLPSMNDNNNDNNYKKLFNRLPS